MRTAFKARYSLTLHTPGGLVNIPAKNLLMARKYALLAITSSEIDCSRVVIDDYPRRTFTYDLDAFGEVAIMEMRLV